MKITFSSHIDFYCFRMSGSLNTLLDSAVKTAVYRLANSNSDSRQLCLNVLTDQRKVSFNTI